MKGRIAKKELPTSKRSVASVTPTELVRTSFLQEGSSLPLVMSPAMDGIDLAAWAGSNRELIETNLLKYGGILFRGFKVSDLAAFQQFIRAISPDLLEYRERSSPRSHVSDNIYTSTEHPAHQTIFLHNESSYQDAWPLKIAFYCSVAPQQGGETPIANVRNVFQRLDPAIRDKFIEKKIMYVRNLSQEMGLPWENVFQTTDKGEVENYCRENGLMFEWLDGNRLRTRAVRHVVATHPKTGDVVWFNHGTFFHVSTLEPEVRDALLAQFAEEDLPSNTYYGDGSPIEPEVLDVLRAAYHQETIKFPWQLHDVLLLDNMLTAHARAPFSGPRKILVGMAEPIQAQDVTS